MVYHALLCFPGSGIVINIIKIIINDDDDDDVTKNILHDIYNKQCNNNNGKKNRMGKNSFFLSGFFLSL